MTSKRIDNTGIIENYTNHKYKNKNTNIDFIHHQRSIFSIRNFII